MRVAVAIGDPLLWGPEGVLEEAISVEGQTVLCSQTYLLQLLHTPNTLHQQIVTSRGVCPL